MIKYYDETLWYEFMWWWMMMKWCGMMMYEIMWFYFDVDTVMKWYELLWKWTVVNDEMMEVDDMTLGVFVSSYIYTYIYIYIYVYIYIISLITYIYEYIGTITKCLIPLAWWSAGWVAEWLSGLWLSGWSSLSGRVAEWLLSISRAVLHIHSLKSALEPLFKPPCYPESLLQDNKAQSHSQAKTGCPAFRPLKYIRETTCESLWNQNRLSGIPSFEVRKHVIRNPSF